MAKVKEPGDWKIVYMSETRYYKKDYPYRIELEDRGEEKVICHQYMHNGEWKTSHSIGLTKKDLTNMLEAIEKK